VPRSRVSNGTVLQFDDGFSTCLKCPHRAVVSKSQTNSAALNPNLPTVSRDKAFSREDRRSFAQVSPAHGGVLRERRCTKLRHFLRRGGRNPKKAKNHCG